jgi:hypothetical protein
VEQGGEVLRVCCGDGDAHHSMKRPVSSTMSRSIQVKTELRTLIKLLYGNKVYEDVSFGLWTR